MKFGINLRRGKGGRKKKKQLTSDAVDVDKVGDGEYLVSLRNFDQAIVVNRSTDAIDMRLGSDDDYAILDEQHNPDYLGRLFKTVMSRPIGVYINDQRVHYSVTRLVSTSDTVEKVAHECGFASRRNYIRQFKARMGATPSEIRLRYRMMHITNV